MTQNNSSQHPERAGADRSPTRARSGSGVREGAAARETTRTLGARGEDHARRYLERLDYRILDTNWRCHEGEIDIVALDGREVVVVEVKTRRSARFGPAVEAVTHEKHLRLRRLAALWMREHEARGPVRVDVIGIEVTHDDVRIDHRARVIL